MMELMSFIYEINIFAANNESTKILSGKEIFPCNDSMSILECTQNMVGDSWNTYTEFYTHASNFCVPIESICFYISTEIWQENTENIINELTTLSLKLSKDLYHMEIIIEEMN